MASNDQRESQTTNREPILKASRSASKDEDINVLLMGSTGVGKTTFINALLNYMVHNTLEEGVVGELLYVISSSFSVSNSETFEEDIITVGDQDKFEKFSHEGQSATQLCRSFIFPIGNRRLRIIDTPGVCDTRGLDQDTKNLQEIFTYIAQFEHLNGICVLLQPGEARLTIQFRFCVNELLRHLHTSAKDNLLFVFTHARSTNYRPGNSVRLLRALLNDHREKYNVEIPLNQGNSFLFDSEPFRCLALRKHGLELDEDLTQSYQSSWDHSVKECVRFLSQIVQRPVHLIWKTISLNDAEQLIRNLPRPIAETARLIEENIQLAQKYKQKVLENPELLEEGLPQNMAHIHRLNHPRTVCTNKKCCRVIDVNGQKKIDYITICHDDCFLNGVEQETLGDARLEDCTAIEFDTGCCMECTCHWSEHMHITYEYITDRTYIRETDTPRSSTTDSVLSLNDIDRRISALRREAQHIQDVYKQLAEFLHSNAMLPFNDALVDYLQYFIQEEQTKQKSNADNGEVIGNLERMKEDFKEHIELIKSSLAEKKNVDAQNRSKLQPEDISRLIQSLYDLPITGKQIREQVEGILIGHDAAVNRQEHYVELPIKAETSNVMEALMAILR